MSVFKIYLRPKFHYLIHYYRILKNLGPLWPLSCIRNEGRLKPLKEYARAIKNRNDICYSVCERNQIELCELFFSRKGFTKKCEYKLINSIY